MRLLAHKTDLRALLSAGLLLIVLASAGAQESYDFRGWPGEFEGETLKRKPIGLREHHILRNLQGRAGLFTAGRSELLYRWTPEIGAALRSARIPLTDHGYRLGEPGRVEREGEPWSCFLAAKGLDKLQVCERITDDRGQVWTDFGEWLREAKAARTRPPWQAVTLFEPMER